jgi:hypothetical protein
MYKRCQQCAKEIDRQIIEQDMGTNANTGDKPTVLKWIHRFHFFFLYVLLYSVFRNGLWFVDPMTDTESTLLRYMTIFGFIWFLGANFYIVNSGLKGTWTRDDYLSPYVLSLAVTTICVLELFVFDR